MVNQSKGMIQVNVMISALQMCETHAKDILSSVTYLSYNLWKLMMRKRLWIDSRIKKAKNKQSTNKQHYSSDRMGWKRKKAHSNVSSSSLMEQYLYKESKNDESTPLRKENKPTNKAISIYNHQPMAELMKISNRLKVGSYCTS